MARKGILLLKCRFMGECGVLIETMFSVPTRNKISSGIDTKLYFALFFSPSILLIRRNSENLFKVFIILFFFFFYHFIFYGRMKTIQSLRKVCAFENLNMKFNEFKTSNIVSKFSTKKRGKYIYKQESHA